MATVVILLSSTWQLLF